MVARALDDGTGGRLSLRNFTTFSVLLLTADGVTFDVLLPRLVELKIGIAISIALSSILSFLVIRCSLDSEFLLISVFLCIPACGTDRARSS